MSADCTTTIAHGCALSCSKKVSKELRKPSRLQAWGSTPISVQLETIQYRQQATMGEQGRAVYLQEFLHDAPI